MGTAANRKSIREAIKQTSHVVKRNIAKVCHIKDCACKLPATYAKSNHNLWTHREHFVSTTRKGGWMANHMAGTEAEQEQILQHRNQGHQ